MKWRVSVKDEIKQIREKDLGKKMDTVEVEAEDRWSAVVKAYKKWNLQGVKMQHLFDICSVKKAEKRYERGWKEL